MRRPIWDPAAGAETQVNTELTQSEQQETPNSEQQGRRQAGMHPQSIEILEIETALFYFLPFSNFSLFEPSCLDATRRSTTPFL